MNDLINRQYNISKSVLITKDTLLDDHLFKEEYKLVFIIATQTNTNINLQEKDIARSFRFCMSLYKIVDKVYCVHQDMDVSQMLTNYLCIILRKTADKSLIEDIISKWKSLRRFEMPLLYLLKGPFKHLLIKENLIFTSWNKNNYDIKTLISDDIDVIAQIPLVRLAKRKDKKDKAIKYYITTKKDKSLMVKDDLEFFCCLSEVFDSVDRSFSAEDNVNSPKQTPVNDKYDNDELNNEFICEDIDAMNVPIKNHTIDKTFNLGISNVKGARDDTSLFSDIKAYIDIFKLNLQEDMPINAIQADEQLIKAPVLNTDMQTCMIDKCKKKSFDIPIPSKILTYTKYESSKRQIFHMNIMSCDPKYGKLIVHHVYKNQDKHYNDPKSDNRSAHESIMKNRLNVDHNIIEESFNDIAEDSVYIMGQDRAHVCQSYKTTTPHVKVGTCDIKQIHARDEGNTIYREMRKAYVESKSTYNNSKAHSFISNLSRQKNMTKIEDNRKMFMRKDHKKENMPPNNIFYQSGNFEAPVLCLENIKESNRIEEEIIGSLRPVYDCVENTGDNDSWANTFAEKKDQKRKASDRIRYSHTTKRDTVNEKYEARYNFKKRY